MEPDHSTLNRRTFLSYAGAFGAPLLAYGQSEPAKTGETVVAKTAYGRVRGANRDGVMVFKGVPYGGSLGGANRFKAPTKPKPWTGVRDALLYGPQAIQPPDPNWPKDWKPAVSDEDCLYLNVWTQGLKNGHKRPVMFYSHGGGFATGNGGADVPPQNLSHDGAALAKSYDVVVVTHNHRLGLMGYLYLGDLLGEEYEASGAAGMLDIALALEWVRDNIAEFGGDPNNVMIWGESGGGAKTTTLTALPRVKGLFHKASIESGATLRLRTRESAMETTRLVLAKADLKESEARRLTELPADRLREIQSQLSRRPPGSGTGSATAGLSGAPGFSPVVDGRFIPAHPYDPLGPEMSAKIPLIVGTNKDETIFMMRSTPELFSLNDAGLRERLKSGLGDNTDRVIEVYRKSRPNASPTDLYVAITTAQWMWNNAITLAERKIAQQGAPVYMYMFAYESEVPVNPSTKYPMKAAHAMEIAFKFNHPENNRGAGNRPERFKAAHNMSKAWATFARTGNPSHDEIPKWPPYSLDERATMILNAECKLVNDPYREERLVWKEIAGKQA